MPQRVMNHQLEWELSQWSLNLMGPYSSPMRKVSAKSFPWEGYVVSGKNSQDPRTMLSGLKMGERHLESLRPAPRHMQSDGPRIAGHFVEPVKPS
jgi:hypothetical protein